MRTQQTQSELDEKGRRADSIYNRDIAPRFEPDHNGEYVVIDVDSGDYEVDPDPVKAMDRLRSRRPNVIFWTRRVADPCAGRLRSPRFKRACPGLCQ